MILYVITYFFFCAPIVVHLKLSDGTAAVKNFFFINEISSPWLLLGALFEQILCGESTHEKVAFSLG